MAINPRTEQRFIETFGPNWEEVIGKHMMYVREQTEKLRKKHGANMVPLTVRVPANFYPVVAACAIIKGGWSISRFVMWCMLHTMTIHGFIPDVTFYEGDL